MSFRKKALSGGTPVGVIDCASRPKPVCIPDSLRMQHVHLIGMAGQGKSICMEHMILHDIECGHGAAVIDPSGDMVADLLRRLPARHLDRIVYFNPGDPDWVPIWNPLRCGAGLAAGRVADDIVRAFRRFTSGWGDRLEHPFRQAILGVLHLPDGTQFDIYNLLRRGTPESQRLRQRILAVVEHPVTRLFWERDFLKYTLIDLVPPLHMLSKLLTNVTICRMFAQPENRFDFRDMMDNEKILLVDLSTVGGDARDILGCLVLSLLHLSTLARSESDPASRKPYHIYCDQAQHLLPSVLTGLIFEARRFNVSLTLAHQYLGQLDESQVDAVCSVGSTILFRINGSDAAYMERNLLGGVGFKDLVGLNQFQAIARLGTDLVPIRTYPPPPVPKSNQTEAIIRQSHQRYYRPVGTTPGRAADDTK